MHPKSRVVKFLSVISVIAVLTVLPGIPLFEISAQAKPEPIDRIGTQGLQLEKVVVSVNPDEDTEINSPSEKIKLNIPKGAVTSETEIEFIEYTPPASTDMQIISLFELNAKEKHSAKAISKFNTRLEITIEHDEEDLRGIDVDSLRLYYFDEKKQQWLPAAGGKYDPKDNSIKATTDHFSTYGEFANPNIVGPGRIMASQVNLHSGTAISSYPLELPPGPGGFQPSLTMTYNSGSADEMKNKKAVGSWVGIGWSLSLGSISYAELADQYYLDLNGASYELVSTDGLNFHTNPEQYLKITRNSVNGNTWEVLDREGIYYRFGGTTDSEQYIDGNNYYRWDLNLMEDTNGNQAAVTYVRDIRSNTVRSAYPEYLTYGDVEIHFTSSWDQNTTDGYVRYDNPISYTYSYTCYVPHTYWDECAYTIPYQECELVPGCWGYYFDPNPYSPYIVTGDGYYWDPYVGFWCYGPTCEVLECGPVQNLCVEDWVTEYIPTTCYDTNPGPKVMETRKLDSIEVKVSDTLVREYDFAYNTTDRVYSGDYGGVYYAGKHTLTSITQVGSDGTSTLPAMTFTYQDLQTYRYSTTGGGVPENPASFNWPHLTAVNSGFGGSISFSYTQTPDTSAQNIWTREVVTTKTINSGIGGNATYTYEYTGNPQYIGTDWDQKYRGFGEVKETDAAGNYAIHWYYTGEIEGDNADKLTGREYQTQWYDSSQTLLRAQESDWDWYQGATNNYIVRLDQVEETIGNKTSRTRYEYDDYGNVVTEYIDGDLDTTDDDATVLRTYYPNTTDNILSRPAKEQVLDSEENVVKETVYYYDNGEDQDHDNTNWQIPPVKGNLTRSESKYDSSHSVSSYFTYDTYGNMLTSTDPKGNTTTWTYEITYNTYPATTTYPITGLSESYVYEPGSGVLLSVTNANGQTTTAEYDTFKRIIKIIRPGDSSVSPSAEYQYNDWGTLNQQHLKTLTRVSEGNYLWQSQYFDGLGRVVQVHSNGETGCTIISGTTVFNNRGLADKQYISQDLASSQVSGYYAPEAGWKYSSYVYDGLGRVTVQNNADGTTVNTDYSIPWQTSVTNPRGFISRYYNDAFGRLVKVEEPDASNGVYATTLYTYDTLGNLVQVTDDDSNVTTISYDWLGRKTSMTDPDMGTWSYVYDSNGNLMSQTDAKGQTIIFDYDELNRLKEKQYPGSGMADVIYTYDSGTNGKGMRTGMTDAIGSNTYTYDARGRLIVDTRTIDSVDYVTQFAYDGADRPTATTYPTGETVTNSYNGTGLPYAVSGSVAGSLVTGTLYNHLGQITEINLGNGLRTTFGYWDVGGSYDTTGGYYGRLWEIKTFEPGESTLQDMKYTWDEGGNLAQRENIIAEETETFGYDSLDRLISVSGPYSAGYTYNEIGNIMSMNGVSYTYGSQPHAVTDVGETEYAYDDNGNMTDRDDQTITWDVENRPVSVSDGVNTSTFIYDGDGNRVLRTEGGETVLYINMYYEKNLTTEEVITSYYLSGKLVATRTGDTLEYVHQDHLSGTALVSDSSGDLVNEISYYPYGSTRAGDVPTDKKFTGQRLDGTGLYYYGARYYDPAIGRFINADIIAPDYNNPQSLNRYSYCFNNPLRYIDPTGQWPWDTIINWVQTALDVVGMIPVIGEIADAVNGVIYTARGDVANAALSFAACVPVAGIAATGAKWVKRGVEFVDKVDDVIDAARAVDKVGDVADTIRAVDKASDAADVVRSVGKNVHGNSLLSTKTNYGYVLREKTTGDILKFGETTNPARRYTRTFTESINARMETVVSGSKKYIHQWQHEQIVDWRVKYGTRPSWNKSDW